MNKIIITTLLFVVTIMMCKAQPVSQEKMLDRLLHYQKSVSPCNSLFGILSNLDH